MTKRKCKSAQILGTGLAIFQHSFDKLFEWGFKEMKKKSEITGQTKNESKFLKGLKKVGGFLGVMGEEYYKKYEELKRRSD